MVKSNSVLIVVREKKYDIYKLDDLTIELRRVHLAETNSSEVDTTAIFLTLEFKSKYLGIQLIQQQNTDILRKSNDSNLIYLWVGFETSLDLVYFDLSKSVLSKTKTKCTGQSILSFCYSKQIGNLSLIQVMDTALGSSTFVGFHFICKQSNGNMVTIYPIDAYTALYYGEKVIIL